MQSWLGGWALLLAASGCIGLSHEQLSPLPRTGGDESVLPDATVAKLTSFGFDTLLSDYYWLQAIQIAGGRAGPVGQSHRIGALIDLVTELNPRVDHPYRFAALWMTDDLDAVRKANRLLERGIEAHPEEWRNRFYLAFNHFFFLGENEQAADALLPAVSLPGSPRYIGGLVARLRSDRDGLDASAAFLSTLLEGTTDPMVHELYEVALREIETERRARLLDQAREVFRQRQGRDLTSVDELVDVAPHVLRRLPADPFDDGWEIDDQGVIVSAGLGHRYVPQIDATSRKWIESVKSKTGEKQQP